MNSVKFDIPLRIIDWRFQMPLNCYKNIEARNIQARMRIRVKSFKLKKERLLRDYKFFSKIWDDEIITGVLLSDAHLRNIKDGQNSCIEMIQTYENKEFVLSLKEHLEELGFSTGLYTWKKIKLKNGFNWGLKVFSFRDRFFTFQRKRWYRGSLKIIPNDLVITPKVLAYWFMGDGTANWKNKEKSKVSVNLSTHGFEIEDVQKLVLMLEKQLNLSFGMHKAGVSKTGRIYYRMGIDESEEVFKFMKLIESYILPIFHYKLKYPIVSKRSEWHRSEEGRRFIRESTTIQNIIGSNDITALKKEYS